jgi:hypothetical protein
VALAEYNEVHTLEDGGESLFQSLWSGDLLLFIGRFVGHNPWMKWSGIMCSRGASMTEFMLTSQIY